MQWQGRFKAGLDYLVWSGLVELVEHVELVELVELDELVELVWIWSECFVDGLARSIESLESSLGGKMLDPTVAWLPTLPLLPLLLPIQMSNFLTFVSFLLVGSLRFVVVWGYMLLKGERESGIDSSVKENNGSASAVCLTELTSCFASLPNSHFPTLHWAVLVCL